MQKGRDCWLVLAGGIALASGLFALSPDVQSHDWYPMECCHSTDCAPVDSTAQLIPMGGGIPQMVVTSKHGTAIISQNFPRQASKDNRMHVCMRRMPNGTMQVLCLFIPPST